MSNPFLRASAWALVLGGLFVVLNDLSHLGFVFAGGEGDAGEEDLAAVARHPVFLLHGASHVAYGILLMIGLAGLGTHHARRLGRTGVAVVLLAIVGQGLLFGMYYGYTVGAGAAPDVFLADEGPPGLFQTVAPLALFLGMGGLALTGLTLGWRGVAPWWLGGAIAVSAVGFLVAPVPAGPEALLGGLLVVLGLRLRRDLVEAVHASADPGALPAG